MKTFRNIFLPLMALVIMGNIFKQGMLYLQQRHGVIFPDPVHALFGPYALHIPIFIVTYLPIVLGIILIWPYREKRSALIYAYCLLQAFRLTSIFLVPFEAPPAMITLHDPISDHLVFGSVITKDLFFSGHVSALTLFALSMPKPFWKKIFAFLALADAVLLTLQHVHYSIDVLAAPLAAYAAFKLQAYINERNFFQLS